MKHILTTLSLGLAMAVSAHADVSGASSNTNYIKVGGTEYTGGDHGGSPLGSPGVGVHTSKTPFKTVGLSRLRTMAIFGLGGGYNWSKQVAFIDENHWLMPSSHNDFGHYAFGRVSSGSGSEQKVYFGEWSDEDNINDGTHTVFYVGKDKTTSMPTSGTATYSVRGINNARNTNVLTGNLNANFSTNRIGGSISNGGLTVSINNNAINPATASFSGSATANGVGGTSRGEFFGNNAAALGGIAEFNNSSLDTAFAGTKQ